MKWNATNMAGSDAAVRCAACSARPIKTVKRVAGWNDACWEQERFALVW